MSDIRRSTVRGAAGHGRSGLIRDRAGQAMAEMAIVLPILVLLVMGIIEFGLAFRTHQIITNSAREGARVAVLPSTDTQDTEDAVRSRLENSGLNPDEAEIIFWCTDPNVDPPEPVEGAICSSSGHETEVEVGYCHRFFLLAPLVAAAGGSDYCTGSGEVDIRTSSTMRTE